MTGPRAADDVPVAVSVDRVVRPARCTTLPDPCGVTAGRCGLATCLGGATVTLGSWVLEPVAVCDIAVPLGPHNNAVDRIATAERATTLDDNLMTMSFPNPGRDMPS